MSLGYSASAAQRLSRSRPKALSVHTPVGHIEPQADALDLNLDLGLDLDLIAAKPLFLFTSLESED